MPRRTRVLLLALALALATTSSARATDAIDWQTLCAGDAVSPVDARHARYVFLDDSAPDPVTRTLVVPKSLVRAAHARDKTAPEFTHRLTLAFSLPPARAGQSAADPAARFAAIAPARRLDEDAPGDAVLLQITVFRNYWLRDWRQFGAAVGLDADSGLTRIKHRDESGPLFNLFGPRTEDLARLDGARRTMLYTCGLRAGGACTARLDRTDDGIEIALTFARPRLREAQALEETARALLRCFVKGG